MIRARQETVWLWSTTFQLIIARACNSTVTKFIDAQTANKLREKAVMDFLLFFLPFFFRVSISVQSIINLSIWREILSISWGEWKGERGSKMFLFVFNHKLDFIRDSIISDKLGLRGDKAFVSRFDYRFRRRFLISRVQLRLWLSQKLLSVLDSKYILFIFPLQQYRRSKIENVISCC